MIFVKMIDKDGKDLGTTWVSSCPPLGARFPVKGEMYFIGDEEFPEPSDGSDSRLVAIFTLMSKDEYYGLDNEDR